MNYTASISSLDDTTELFLTYDFNTEENLAFTQFDSNFESVVLALLEMVDFTASNVHLTESRIDQDFVFKMLPKIKINYLSIDIYREDEMDISTWIEMLSNNIQRLEVSFFECFKKKSKDIQFMIDYLTQNKSIRMIKIFIDIKRSTNVRDHLDISDCWEIDITQRNTCILTKKNSCFIQ